MTSPPPTASNSSPLLHLHRIIESVIGHRFDDIAPMNTIARVKTPVLLVHDREDDVVLAWLAVHQSPERLQLDPGQTK